MAAVALVGCNKSEEGGRTGTDTFNVAGPAIGTDIKQGELQTVQISVKRNAGFKQDVKLAFKAPTGSGLDVDPGSITVKAGDKGDVQVKITAAKDAPLGAQTILVEGTPDKGDPAKTEFKVTVSAK